MNQVLSATAKKMSKNKKRKMAWRGVVRSLAMVIIFCTTYALILPAITMQSDPICGMEAHSHNESCYELIQRDTLTCTLEESEGHTHSETCCTPVETQPHTHDELCCTMEESEAHTHSEACCPAMEAEAHTHSEICCSIEEHEGHAHEDGCWTHIEELSSNLICGFEEHTHTDNCYPLETEPTGDEGFNCGYAQHTHKEKCEDDCNIVEHIHEAKCVLDYVDMNADVESADQWKQMAADQERTGIWSQDLLTLAESQMGYSESEVNVVLSGEDLYGYTRYGDWYGNPYQDWESLFIAFCLNYAGITEDDIPHHSDAEHWMEMLDQKGLLQDPEENHPKPGSIIFWKNDGGKLSTAVVQKNEKSTCRVIAGDVDGRVDHLVVKLKKIVAVCDLDLAQGIEPVVEETEQTEPEGIETQATEPEATEPKVTEPEITEPEATEPEATEPKVNEPEATEPEQEEVTPVSRVHIANTKNYTVTVTCPEHLILPEGAELQVSEYDKNSDTYRRRCAEVGYELEWLLNIGFYLNGEELELNGDFQVEVTSKKGQYMSEEITHFADSGTETLAGNADDESVSFTSDGFSDFGGGNANTRAATTVYNFKTVEVLNNWNQLNLKSNTNYVAYVIQNNQIIFLSSNGYDLVPIFVQNVNGTTTNNSTWSLSTSQLYGDASNFTWQLVTKSGTNYLVTQNGSRYLELYNGWCTLGNGTAIVFERKNAGAEVGSRNGNQTYELRYADAGDGDYKWRASWYNDNGQLSTPTETVYFAEISTTTSGGVTPPSVSYPNYPHAVHTGEISINRLRFYNLCENGNEGVSGLAGCVFEITGPNGYKATVTSTNNSYVELPTGMPDGSYTITEVSVPKGYVRDSDYQRTFKISGGNLASDGTIGTFINHNVERITNSKTAEVEDYANRIYKITLTAKSNMRRYELEPIDVLFVVDQSNSMLFPAELDDTGHKVTLTISGNGNDTAMNRLNLDRSQVYYIIADPEGSSTVWAVWHDGQGWMCQDASYYAKAKHNNDPGYQDDNETVIFPTYGRSYAEQKSSEASGVRSNGGSLNKDLTGSSLGTYLSNMGNTHTFTLYTTDNEFNRLHYLEQSLANIIYQLADANGENRVSLTEFTKVLGLCEGPHELSTHADYLVSLVTDIKTSGGTRQDIALEHIAQQHLSQGGQHFDKGVDRTYTLLITDGAPVGTSSEPVGDPDDKATTSGFGSNGVSIYGRIKGWAAQVRTKSTLMTVGLGMENVEGGKQVLREIASSNDFYSAMDDASELEIFVQKLLFESFRAKEYITVTGDIVDDISESFYPIAWVNRGAAGQRKLLSSDSTRDWVLLNAGDWITLDGKLTSAGAADAAGQLLQRQDGTYYVQWMQQTISGESGWKGVIYVKAKEDFIGGNGIDTNKSNATLTVTVNDQTVVREMESPTVNVRLLGINENHSTVTVYLGDWVNGEGSAPIDSLREFYDDTYFTKLISDGGKPLNKVSAGSNGLENAVFYLRYAMGRDLSEEEWNLLQNGNSITVPYIYDDASSHGNVGYFTFSLEKEGNLTYAGHEAHTACQPGGTPSSEDCDEPAETYVLNVTYTAYRLGESGRPESNVHNGTKGPGTEVGTGNRLTNGLGVLAMENIHEVHVISGEIEIWKYFDEGIRDPDDRTFTFNLNKLVNGEVTVVDTKTITIPAGANQGSEKITFTDLPRGTYTVTEVEDADYVTKHISVLASTNCESIPEQGGSAMELRFVMGNNTAKENVIGFAQTTDRYTSYIDPVNGVYGAAAFTNGLKIIETELPVEKIWDDAEGSYASETVYVALYLNDIPVATNEGHLRILKLDARNDWKGSFIVPLADENETLADYNYSIRELSQVLDQPHKDWATGILEGSDTIVYYEKALDQGSLFHTPGKSYFVEYGVGDEGQLTVTNSRMFELPKTGGMGTKMYTISGLTLIIAAALIFGFSQRRTGKGGKVV